MINPKQNDQKSTHSQAQAKCFVWATGPPISWCLTTGSLMFVFKPTGSRRRFKGMGRGLSAQVGKLIPMRIQTKN